MSEYARCKYCQEPVLWLKSASTGRLAPIDAHPVPDGNVAVDSRAEVYIVLTGEERLRFDSTTHDRNARPSLHTNHFQTCRNVTAVRLARERQKQRGHSKGLTPVDHTARTGPTKNRCPALGCTIYVPRHRLACSTHWFALPAALRDRINATYKRDTSAHLAAYREAVSLLTRAGVNSHQESQS